MPSKSANVTNEKQYEALTGTGTSKERRIANSPDASKHGSEQSHSGTGTRDRGGTTALHRAAGSTGGKASAVK